MDVIEVVVLNWSHSARYAVLVGWAAPSQSSFSLSARHCDRSSPMLECVNILTKSLHDAHTMDVVILFD
jgi:hypothetical protein